MNLSSLLDKTGSLGAIVATMGCASCFPLLASFGASIGLGFLASFEGLFINKLLPIFALIALASNLYAGYSHRKWLRLLMSITGPLMVLATLYLFWTDNWSTYMFYVGLLLMLSVSIWDLVSPAKVSCENPQSDSFKGRVNP